jgi:multimeric flavodoxin WrbA
MINTLFDELHKDGIETEMVQFAGKRIRGCTACGKCVENLDKKCIIDNDIVNDCIEKMISSDAIILGSPTYFADLTSELKALIDRAGYVARANSHLFKRKIGAAVVAVRRAGSIHVFDSINHFFLISQMIVPGSIYWNMGIGRAIGDVEQDEEGLETMRALAQNISWLLKKVNT